MAIRFKIFYHMELDIGQKIHQNKLGIHPFHNYFLLAVYLYRIVSILQRFKIPYFSSFFFFFAMNCCVLGQELPKKRWMDGEGLGD